MRAAKLDVCSLGPFAYLIAHEKTGAQAIVAPGTPVGEINTYRSILVVPGSSSIRTIEDVRTHASKMTLAWVDRPTWKLGVMLGVLHGAAMLLRAEHLLLMEMLCALAAWQAWRGRVAPGRIATQTLWVLLAAVAVCAPWSLRAHAAAERFNTQAPALPYASAQPPWTPAAQAFMDGLPAFAREGNFAFLSAQSRQAGLKVVDEPDVRAFFEREWKSVPEPLPTWSLVSFKGSLDFALSNHPSSDGGFSKAGLSDSHDREPPFSLARPSHTRLVNHGFEVGWGFIRADPARWMRLVGEKRRENDLAAMPRWLRERIAVDYPGYLRS